MFTVQEHSECSEGDWPPKILRPRRPRPRRVFARLSCPRQAADENEGDMEKRCADRHMDQSDHSWLSGHASVRSGTQGLRGTRRAMLLLLMLLPALHAVGTGHLPYTGTHAGTCIWSTGADPKLDWSGRTRFHAHQSQSHTPQLFHRQNNDCS